VNLFVFESFRQKISQRHNWVSRLTRYVEIDVNAGFQAADCLPPNVRELSAFVAVESNLMHSRKRILDLVRLGRHTLLQAPLLVQSIHERTLSFYLLPVALWHQRNKPILQIDIKFMRIALLISNCKGRILAQNSVQFTWVRILIMMVHLHHD